MDLTVNLGNLLTLAVVVIGFVVWSKTTVAVLATRVDQHTKDLDGLRAALVAEVSSLKRWQVDQDKKIGDGVDGLREEIAGIRERLVRIETMLARALGSNGGGAGGVASVGSVSGLIGNGGAKHV